MKFLLIVCAIIAGIILFLHLIKAKVFVFFGDEKRVIVKLPFFTFDTTNSKKSEKKKKEKKTKKDTDKKLLYFSDFCKIAGKAIRVFNRKLVIKKLQCHIIVATDDAAKTALTFGKVSAGANIFCGAICNNFKVIERDIRINADFTTQKSVYDIYVNMELSLLGGLLIAYAAAVCALRAIIKNKKTKAV